MTAWSAAPLRVGGRPVFCFAQDSQYAGGSLGAQHADTIVQRPAPRARRRSVPVVGFVESGGARMQEGLAALNGYARIFSEHVAMSGRVPQISVITGTSAGGGCYSPALTDFVVMTDAASMFLTGPAVVREVTGEDVTRPRARRPRRTRPQRRLPLHGGHRHRRDLPRAPAARLSPGERLDAADADGAADPSGPIPAASSRSMAVASTTCVTAIDGIVDAGSILEASPRVGAEPRHGVRTHRGSRLSASWPTSRATSAG